MNTTTSSFNSEFVKIGLTTSSIHFTTQSLNTQTGSQNQINLGISIVTGSINLATSSINFTTGALNIFSGSIRIELNSIESYTASLKSVGLVSGSQQILDYNLFALTASNNTFYGENRFENKVTHTNGYIVLTQVSQSLNFVDDAAAAAGGVPLGGLYRNGNFIAIRIV
jgi:hypothetical protein